MDGGFPYGDIIVIGAIAAFILLRYRAMLGENSGRDVDTRPASPVAGDQPRVIQLPLGHAVMPIEKKDDFSADYGALAEKFTAMRSIDPAFTPDEFLGGARTAYEMVIAAFSKRDHDTLKMLLSEDMYKSFSLSLVDAEKEKRFNDTTLIAISESRITAAQLVGAQATITVDFVSDQIHLIRDAAGAIIEGDVSQQNRVEDSWVFTRNLSSSNPDWTIIET